MATYQTTGTTSESSRSDTGPGRRLAAALLVRTLQDAHGTGEHAADAAAWLATDEAHEIGAALGVDVRRWQGAVVTGQVKRAAEHYTAAQRARRHTSKTRRGMDAQLQYLLYQDMTALVRQYENDAAKQVTNILAQLLARPRLLELAGRLEEEIPALERQIAADEQTLVHLAAELQEATRHYDEAQLNYKAAENSAKSPHLAELALNEARKVKIGAESRHRETEDRLRKTRSHLQRAKRIAAELRELPEPDRALLAGLLGGGEDVSRVSGVHGNRQRHSK